MTDLDIRPYQISDRQAVFRIAADTAFFGEPVENFLEDRQLFCDLFYRYYTDYEGSAGSVACAGDTVVGFLMGSLDTRGHGQRVLRRLVPGVLKGIVTSRYKIGRKTWHYAIGLVRSAIQGEFVSCDLSIYPAHLHINVDAGWRGHRLGRRLMETYVGQLKSLGVPGVHLHTTSINEAACALYERMGFILVDARRTSLWSNQVARNVENRCYGLRIPA